MQKYPPVTRSLSDTVLRFSTPSSLGLKKKKELTRFAFPRRQKEQEHRDTRTRACARIVEQKTTSSINSNRKFPRAKQTEELPHYSSRLPSETVPAATERPTSASSSFSATHHSPVIDLSDIPSLIRLSKYSCPGQGRPSPRMSSA